MLFRYQITRESLLSPTTKVPGTTLRSRGLAVVPFSLINPKSKCFSPQKMILSICIYVHIKYPHIYYMCNTHWFFQRTLDFVAKTGSYLWTPWQLVSGQNVVTINKSSISFESYYVPLLWCSMVYHPRSFAKNIFKIQKTPRFHNMLSNPVIYFILKVIYLCLIYIYCTYNCASHQFWNFTPIKCVYRPLSYSNTHAFFCAFWF